MSTESVLNSELDKLNKFNANQLNMLRQQADIDINSIMESDFKSEFIALDDIKLPEERKMRARNLILTIYVMVGKILILNEPRVIEKLKQEVLTEKEARWIIPSTELEEVIDNIFANNMFIDTRIDIYSILNIYLSGKFFCALVERIRLNFPKSKNQSEYKLLMQTIGKHERRTKKVEVFDFLWDSLNIEFGPKLSELFDNDVSLFTYMQNINSSRWDKHLITIFNNIHFHPAYPKEPKLKEKLHALYPLFKLVSKDKNWGDNTFKFGDKIGELDREIVFQKMYKFIFKQ
ncbi:hypothetical protein [Sediminibacterium sp.]|uniref:hypothetical protein n=1 Tax=Sediminibacterium sp. TaxID=1917865 RepID=UPI003F6FCBB4